MFNSCNSLKGIFFDVTKISKMVMLHNMNLKQIQWCKELGFIENIKPHVAKELNMSTFYAIIPPELISEFDSL